MPPAVRWHGYCSLSNDEGVQENRVSAKPWWQCGAIYQLLVPSFLDTDNDGLGDLAGITARLDYLEWLGVNAIWLSPCYPSPLKELGYDVSDYCDIEPRFGSLAAFDRLLEEAHERDLHVILDWVGNHTSAQHPWFRESRSSRSHERRNWYLWRDAGPTALRRTIGSAFSAAASGNGTPRPRSTICTRSWIRSRTSTGASRRCARRCSMP